MEWQQLIGFYHVVQSGGFTKAAKITYRTQSALTQQIKKLEEEFDCQLLERIGKRKILLTPAGERVFAFAQQLVTNYEFLVEEISHLKGLHKGRLRIAAPFTTLSQLLPPKVESFMNQFPQVEISLFDRPQNKVPELILEGGADIGVSLESIVPANLAKVRWRKVETVIMIPVGHPLRDMTEVSLDQIAQYPLILPPKGSIPRKRLEKHFEEKGLTYRVAMESSNVELSAIYVEMGLGISFATIVRNLPTYEQRNFRFLSLDRYFETDYITFIYRKEKATNPILNAFVNAISGEELL